MTFERGEIIAVPFKFTESDIFRRRPVLVLSRSVLCEQTGQVIAAMITTARRSEWPFDIPIEQWVEAGLTTPCTVRLKLSTIDVSIVDRRIGTLDSGTLEKVIDQVATLLT